MKLQKFRWSKVYESSEEELTAFLAARNIVAERWEAEAFNVFDKQQAENDITIWCAEGSLTITVDGQAISMQPGDGLPIPAARSYEMTVGISGCMCYQSNR
jgi:quercetin dioxygenase-like cupin family protein